jgi:hypothetical protein
MTDSYYLGLVPRIPKTLDIIVAPIIQTFASFYMTIWPHEFGHWTRAREIGGEFVFEKLTFPWPKARMELPENVDLFSETLTSTGGFEINNLMRRQIINDYYGNGYSYANMMVHAFIQEIYYPAYAYIIAPLVNGGRIDPEEPDTWINTKGDPVESSLLTYRNYYDMPIPEEDQEVDVRLVNYYKEARTMSVLWTLADPGFYESLRGFGTKMNTDSGILYPKMIGLEDFKWMYNTLFNITPLGYELHFMNHFMINKNYYQLSFHYGRPFQNVGVGFCIPSLLHKDNITMGMLLNYWYQQPYGNGFHVALRSDLFFSDNMGGTIACGWKSQGYLLGLPVDSGFYFRAGILFLIPWPC